MHKKCLYHEAPPSRGTKRRIDEEQIKTEQTSRMKLQTHKERKNCSRGTVLERSRNLTLNSDSALVANIRSVRTGVLYLICDTSQWNTYNQKHCYESKTRIFSENKGNLLHFLQWFTEISQRIIFDNSPRE